MCKKTLILFSSGDVGGAEKSLSRLANVGEKKEYFLGSLSGGGDLFTIHKKKLKKFGYQRNSLLSIIIGCYKAIRFSNQNKINNIYVCGFKACSIIRIFSFFIKTPKIIHAIRWNPISQNITDKFFRIFERFFISRTCRWICNSKSAKKTLSTFCGIPEDRIIVIYNGLEVKKPFIKNTSKEKIVLTLSNFAPRKGIVEYLNVIERVINVDGSIKFIIAGRDDMRGKVQKEIKRKKLESFINTPGFVNNTSGLLESSKLLVLPSLLPEGCPTSILEGMAFGKPAIGYNIEGLNELIINNRTGFLIKKYNQENMAESILGLINNVSLIEKFGHNAYQEVKNNFSLKKMLRKHREVFYS